MRFLPPAVTSFQLAHNNTHNDFASHPIGTLRERIPCGIHFAEGETEARVPTVFSRAYLFYFSLSRGFIVPPAPAAAQQNQNTEAAAREEAAKAIRDSLRGEARNAFRGILALFALRMIFGLEIEERETPPLLDGAETQDPVRRMLARQAQQDPHGEFWDRLTYFVLKTESRKHVVVAGASPLTGFFPAARSLPNLPNLVYWYHLKEGWLDPGRSDRREWEKEKLPVGRQAFVRHALRKWVGEVVRQLTEDTRPWYQELATLKLGWDNIALLKDEFLAWQADLGRTEQEDALASPATDIIGAEVKRFSPKAVPFLSLFVTSHRSFFTDFPVIGGRLMVTTQGLLNPKFRLHGNVTGDPAFAQRLQNLPFEGDDLGYALGLPEKAAPAPFRYLNRVFTPKLTRLTEQDLGKGWQALDLKSSDPGGNFKTKFLFPVAPFIVPHLPLASLPKAVTITDVPGSDILTVTIRFEGAEVSQQYNNPAFQDFVEEKSAERLDLRLFPNLNLDEVADDILPRDGDLRDYYIRMPLDPQWVTERGGDVPADMLTAWRDGGFLTPKESITEGSIHDEETGAVRYYASGLSRILRLGERPEAFCIKDRGFCLVTLPHGPGKTADKRAWKVAVDFGTSNTCVTYADEHGQPKVLTFPMLTTSLFQQPEYAPWNGAAEGQSANLDFFAFDHTGASAQAEEFFPTQICTRRIKPQDDNFSSVRNGITLFRNLSQIVLADSSFAELLEAWNVPSKDGVVRVKPRFRLAQNIKWRPKEHWSDVFMHDLRRNILLAAACKNAKVSDIVFSYPKAFTPREQTGFQRVISSVWKESGLTPKKVSESEGVRNYIADRDWKDCVVLDIGGGTTDVLAFRGKIAFFQMSFRLAADVIDHYVISSSPLREAVCEAAITARVKDAKGLRDKLQDMLGFFNRVAVELPPASTEAMDKCRTVWHGLLRRIASTPEAAHDLRSSLCDEVAPGADPAQKKAITGFFATLLITFGGLAYLCGMSHRYMRAQSGHVLLNDINLTFIGNGGKYYEFLDDGNQALAQFLAQMFRVGEASEPPLAVTCQGVFRDKDEQQRPKAAIALGMLTAGTTPTAIPVCNALSEREIQVGGAQFDEQSQLLDFYQAAVGHFPEVKVGDNSALQSFLTAVDKHCPRGKINGSIVVPDVGAGWAAALLADPTSAPTSLRRNFEARLRSCLQENARMLFPESNDGEGKEEAAAEVAIEPLFISELSALLSVLREEYAGK